MFKNKTVVIMGGGTAGWISALYFLNKSILLNLNLDIKIISSKNIEPIGVGEGTIPLFTHFIENICKIDKKEFLKETKGSFKYGIKFNNWNFDDENYYHLFSTTTPYEFSNKNLDFDFIQYAINEELNIPQKILQKKLLGSLFNLIENNKVDLKINNEYSYHFSADLIIKFLRKKCLEFKNFEHIESTIKTLNYDEYGNIKNLKLDNEQNINGDFFINCLGFKSNNILSKDYFEIQNWDNYILNNSAFAIQVKNSPSEILEPFTTSVAQEYGWSWKIPQYEKSGYGYVYSDHFIQDEDKLFDDLLKTFNLKEKNVFKTKIVKSKPYFNKKQFYKNCLSLGLSSGFVEPLEATSIQLTLMGLKTFFEIIENDIVMNEKCKNNYNCRLEKIWENVFKFIIFHYFTNNPINDYWEHYKNIQKNKIFNFYEKYHEYDDVIFSKFSYFCISLGMRRKDFYFSFSKEKFLEKNIINYIKLESNIDYNHVYSHNKILQEINRTKNLIINY